MSGGNKAIELQFQMRHNSEDMLGFMREMESWEADMKKKDEELRNAGLQEGQVCPCSKHPSIICLMSLGCECCLLYLAL